MKRLCKVTQLFCPVITDLGLTQVFRFATELWMKSKRLQPTTPPPSPPSYRLLALAEKQICRSFLAYKPLIFLTIIGPASV